MNTRRFSYWCYALTLCGWLAIACVPELRQVARFQLAASDMYGYQESGSINAAPDWLLAPFHFPAPRHSTASERLQRHPTNKALRFVVTEKRVRAAARDIADGPSPGGGRSIFKVRELAIYDEQIRRSPRDPLLIAARLCAAMGVDFGPGLDPSSSHHLLPFEKRYPTPAQLRQDLRIARLGQAAEPENSFFDFAAAGILFALHRNDDGLAAIHAAALARSYDEHFADAVRTREAADQVDGYSLITEQKYTLSNADVWDPLMSPSYSVARRIVESALWLARQEGLRGKTRRELQIDGDLTRFAAKMRDCPGPDTPKLMGCVLQEMVWKRSVPFPARYPKPQRQRILAEAQAFAAFAASRGRLDLSREALADAQVDYRILKSIDENLLPWLPGFNISHPASAGGRMARFWWASSLVLAQQAWTLASLFALSTGLYLFRGILALARRVARLPSRPVTGDASHNRLGISSVALLALCSVVATTVALVVLWNLWNEPFAFILTPDDGRLAAACYLFAFLPLVLGLSLGLLGLCWKPRRGTIADNGLHVRHWARLFVPFSLVFYSVGLLWLHLSPGWRTLHIALGIVAAGWLIGIGRQFFPSRNAVPASEGVRPSAGSTVLAWLKVSLQASLCFGALLYLALMLASLPVRHRANAQIDRVIRDGETSLYR